MTVSTVVVHRWIVALAALGLGAGACGVVDQARARLDALLADEAELPAPAEPAPPVEPVVAGSAGESGASSSAAVGGGDASGAAPVDSTGGDASGVAASGVAASGSTGEAVSDGGTGGPPRGAVTGGTDTLPMSAAHPSDPSGDGDSGATDDGAAAPSPMPPMTPAIPLAPASTSLPCLEGEWDAEDLHTYFARDIAKQAHGRTVKHRSESGRYRLRLAPGVLHGEADHRRMAFDARLANVDIRYTVDVHGELEAVTRVEAPDVLVVERPVRTTLRAREVVRFSGKKSESRTLAFPVEGRWQATCGPDTLELRPLEDGKPGPALRFVRPKP